MALQSHQFLTRISSPYFASSIIASRNELVPLLVEGAIRQWQNVCSQDFEKVIITAVIAFQFLDKFYGETFSEFGATDLLYIRRLSCGLRLWLMRGSSKAIWFTSTSTSVLPG